MHIYIRIYTDYSISIENTRAKVHARCAKSWWIISYIMAMVRNRHEGITFSYACRGKRYNGRKGRGGMIDTASESHLPAHRLNAACRRYLIYLDIPGDESSLMGSLACVGQRKEVGWINRYQSARIQYAFSPPALDTHPERRSIIPACIITYIIRCLNLFYQIFISQWPTRIGKGTKFASNIFEKPPHSMVFF